MAPATIGEILQFTIGDSKVEEGKILRWPPDVFAVVGYLLHLSGAYVYTVDKWPPADFKLADDWQSFVEDLGDEWRKNVPSKSPPPKVKEWWGKILKKRKLPISKIKNDPAVWQSLVCLCAVADASCAGIGIPNFKDSKDKFASSATMLLLDCLMAKKASTLCKFIHPSRLVVLPKMHTPQKGISIRSLTHNLALCVGSDVLIRWCEALQMENWQLESKFEHGISVLIVPYPMKMEPAQFEPAAPRGKLRNMSKDFGFFNYLPKPVAKDFPKKMRLLCKRAKEKVGRIDGIIFPEMALQLDEYNALCKSLLPEVSFVICGIYKPATKRRLASNYAKLAARFFENSYVELDQHKHHRWILEQTQICQYGFGSTLDPNRKWWENIELPERTLSFLSLDSWLTISVLICEDLARPDPIANIVRAVGPNLLVALLQDGPQLTNRWSARCATVLADDPGCSVLTLTSAGMSDISRPPQEAFKGTPSPRVIALWKDKDAGTREITLPSGADAMVLCLANTYETEWTADGRHDNKTAGVLKLAGIHAIEAK